MRYEIYQLQGGLWTYVDESEDIQTTVGMVRAQSEQWEGQVIVIDNQSAAIPGMSKPALKLSMEKRQIYDLLFECKLARLLELECRRGEASPIEIFLAAYEKLEAKAAEEVAELLGWECMQKIVAEPHLKAVK